jgi:hypothetical protein
VTGLSAVPLEVPDFAEPFLAWRVWRVVSSRDGYRLASVVKSAIWPPGKPLRAECLRSPLGTLFRRRRAGLHSAPEPACECGIYGAHLALVGDYLAEQPGQALTRVVGEVLLWGTVIECERGYRVSHAYPSRLYLPVGGAGGPESRLIRLRRGLDAYGVPIELLDVRPSEAVRALEQLELASLRRAQ